MVMAAALLAGCVSLTSSFQGQRAESLMRRVSSVKKIQYLLFVPAGVHGRGGPKLPLLIFLHGSGEAGTDLNKLKVQGPPKIVESRPDFPFIVASPQTPDDDLFDPGALDALLDELIERLPVDPDRVYLTGLSLGGEWTYGWASLRPERFAAIAPVSGEWTTAVDCRLKHVPVWAFHGAKDDVVPITADEAMISAINACGGDAHMTVYPDSGHDAWTQAYATEELYTWLLAHRRYAGAR
jgi:predicted peptidase